MPDLPPLIVFDSDDLAVIAASLQDALIRVGDMAYCRARSSSRWSRRGFDWVGAAHETDRLFLLRALPDGLAFRACSQVSCLGFHHKDQSLILNLLDIGFKETEPPGAMWSSFSPLAARCGYMSNARGRDPRSRNSLDGQVGAQSSD